MAFFFFYLCKWLNVDPGSHFLKELLSNYSYYIYFKFGNFSKDESQVLWSPTCNSHCGKPSLGRRIRLGHTLIVWPQTNQGSAILISVLGCKRRITMATWAYWCEKCRNVGASTEHHGEYIWDGSSHYQLVCIFLFFTSLEKHTYGPLSVGVCSFIGYAMTLNLTPIKSTAWLS